MRLLFPAFVIAILCILCGGFESASAAQLNKVAAVVNGQVITMFDLQKEALPELARARLNPNDPAQAKAVDAVFRKVLDLMIMDILIAQEAKRLKVTVSEAEVDNELKRMMLARKLTKEQFEAQLKQQKIPLAGLRANIEKSLLRQKVMGMEVGRRVVVTPDEIKAYYEAHKDTMFDRNGLRMGLLVYHPKANPAAVAAQIKAGKLSFEEAAAKYSIAPNKDKGGDMGPVEWDRLNPEWDGRLSQMKPGDVTELFDLQGHKAQVHLFRPGGGAETPLTLEQATPQIDAILRQPKAKGRFEDYSRQLREKAVIDIRLN
ncbi:MULTISPECIES: SurA N-terminal domain-containing protein [unclassified Desulfovibrio]|uniref:SurA N-terminal domain-containing protein n=1 Tax=unclassified Desulfovibrio TaxID=2593640 RepID=UPI0013EB79BC|nr:MULTISPECIES: SurA N-terminal domain-containing protein [unclassified Desulfovibrio]